MWMITSDSGHKGGGWGHAGVPNSSVEVKSLKAVLVASNFAVHLLILPNGVSQVLPAYQNFETVKAHHVPHNKLYHTFLEITLWCNGLSLDL